MFSERFSSMNISRRLIVLVTSVTLIMTLIGGIVVWELNVAANTTRALNQDISKGVMLNKLSTLVREGFVDSANNVLRGSIIWNEANVAMAQTEQQFTHLWSTYLQALSPEQAKTIKAEFDTPLKQLNTAFSEILTLGETQSRGELELFVLNDLNYLVNPFLSTLNARVQTQQQLSDANFIAFNQTNTSFLYTNIFLTLFGVLITSSLGFAILKSITAPIQQVMTTVNAVAVGDYEARSNLEGHDEISELSLALDQMLNERVNALVSKEKENDQLNDSIIRLLEAVSQLSDKDLTVTVPVGEDVTGPIADAMNLVASETADVLINIRDIASRVEHSANHIKLQGDKVAEMAANERNIVHQTIERLDSASKTMTVIAKLCQSCNQVAGKASDTTQEAYDVVQSSLTGMNEIRETISETEKRIKRLGERSQEISGIVDLINNIAERTNVLALNASMQAAAAGEAGRGFAVVADEVQRLAESSRNATGQISTLVSNIQTETAETMDTMNQTITLVVTGSDRAELAGQQMQATQQTTHELVESVAQIANRSLKQVKLNEILIKKADDIKRSTEKTDHQVQQQRSQTTNLVDYASRLINSVKVFKLPNNGLAINPNQNQQPNQASPQQAPQQSPQQAEQGPRQGQGQGQGRPDHFDAA